jgi:ATP-dependent Lhr-like helicase
MPVTYAAADPMNLVGIVIPGEREASVPGRTVTYPVTAVTEASVAEEAVISQDLFTFEPARLEGGALA